ncbi:thioredoxin domain-containing protein [Thalassoglobus sp. JC818]|uniref:thioredoxin family protein n=1 Tax=Thalassoglobus sp. JC818 TaxID=3232136 RepID=UPI00345A6275
MERFFLFLATLFVVSFLVYGVFISPEAGQLQPDVELMQRLPKSEPDNEWFKETVLSSSIPVLVDFKADWCGPCRALHKVIDEVSKTYAGEIRIVQVDVDEHNDLAYFYHADAIPMVLMFRDGKPVDGFRGLVSAKELDGFVRRNLSAPEASDSAEASGTVRPEEVESPETVEVSADEASI